MNKLVFEEQDGDYIQEVFGWEAEDFFDLRRLMGEFFIETIVRKDGEVSKTQLLKEFIQKNDLEPVFTTANDYFLLGFCFHEVNMKIDEAVETMIEVGTRRKRGKFSRSISSKDIKEKVKEELKSRGLDLEPEFDVENDTATSMDEMISKIADMEIKKQADKLKGKQNAKN